MWYYIFDKKRYGPVDSNKLRDLLELGIINESTPVLEIESAYDWRKLGETELNKLNVVLKKQDSSSTNNYSPDTENGSISDFGVNFNSQVPRVNLFRLNEKFIAWVIFSCLVIIMAFFSYFLPALSKINILSVQPIGSKLFGIFYFCGCSTIFGKLFKTVQHVPPLAKP